ncbi:hypothetical protein [Fimbriimonas ginsengisoli]|uniref:Tudor domain-containing protein n=1 Tax=Fimbriimonas ginsengisoli Gsoil 348 TaxID=661478 RepID=A0A068NS42_FIMGI|nr:hypothetical protein [Fimbriimonas ginsengisoli]AIE84434.1 hypothetical protein OP10G_1066 [Fimbriimonas ginsengisoli Gsoil 348]
MLRTMAETHLTETQVHDVIIRAGEIEQRLRSGANTSELENVLAAAQEAGLSREAVLQAMQEHLDLLGEPPKEGDLVFAKSTDGKFYAAKLLQVGKGAPRVCFLNGGETNVSFEDIRPLAITPGTRVVCKWPDWGDWTSTVIRYDAQRSTVRVSDGWGSEKTFPLAEIQLDIKQFQPKAPIQWANFKWQVAVAFAAAGGIVGSLLTWLLMR